MTGLQLGISQRATFAWFCYVTHPLRGEFRFPCTLTVVPGSAAAAGKQAPEYFGVFFRCAQLKKSKFNNFGLGALAEVRVPSH